MLAASCSDKYCLICLTRPDWTRGRLLLFAETARLFPPALGALIGRMCPFPLFKFTCWYSCLLPAVRRLFDDRALRWRPVPRLPIKFLILGQLFWTENKKKFNLWLTVECRHIGIGATGCTVVRLLLTHYVLLCADRVQEIWVLAESVAILYHLVKYASLTIELPIPLVCTVMWLGGLEATENILVGVGDPGNLLNSHRPIQWVVRIQSVWIWLKLIFDYFGRDDVFRRF